MAAAVAMQTYRQPRRPWHQRYRLFGRGRRAARSMLFHFLAKCLATDDAKQILTAQLSGLLKSPADTLGGLDVHRASPYPDLGVAAAPLDVEPQHAPIFITARFRTGSTLLWNLLRHTPTCTAYYEPLNERRWLDPATRGTRLDATHRHVEDYWREYDGLEELGQYYQERWTDVQLFMDAEAWDPDLQRYIACLIARAPERAVLQFNRVDFRLPWLRRHFPHATIVHLYRHPREQWCSTLMDPTRFTKEQSMAEFEPYDGFYLRRWARDLKYQFPFLAEHTIAHPYQLFYYIWKLSYLFGRTFAHYSLSFEELVRAPASCVRALFEAIQLPHDHSEELCALITPVSHGKWRAYAPEDWLAHQEMACETVLAQFIAEWQGDLSRPTCAEERQLVAL